MVYGYGIWSQPTCSMVYVYGSPLFALVLLVFKGLLT